MVHSVDHGLPIDRFQTMRQHLHNLTFDSQLVTILSVAMGALALALAAIGLYGVLAFSVARRTREIGVRMALGADRHAIAALIVRQVAWFILAGTIAGSLLGWLATRILIHRDNGLATTLTHMPFWTFGITLAVLLVGIFFAALIPARRAASIDPMQALRAE